MSYEVGQKESFSNAITEYHLYEFAAITPDFNPVHVNAVAAEQSMFGQRIAHGILAVGLISTVLGQKLPGNGTIYLSQQAKFLKPVYIGDTITATAEVAEVREKGRLLLKTYAVNQRGEKVVDGEAEVIAPKK